jgi:hypothetical protein
LPQPRSFLTGLYEFARARRQRRAPRKKWAAGLRRPTSVIKSLGSQMTSFMSEAGS